MSARLYFKNQLPVILLHLLGILALSLFLAAGGTRPQSILFLAVVWMTVVSCVLTAAFLHRKNRLNQLLSMTAQLDERYLIAELMPDPKQASEQVFYQILKMAEASMLEKIGDVRREQKDYQEYIEQWIHEMKTPITAIQLLCETNRSAFTRELLAELEKISHYTEQTLYYARSGHVQKDYSIREIQLDAVIHDAIADHKYLLRQHQAAVTVDPAGYSVFTDDKWVRFILSQLIGNAVKYSRGQPRLHFSTAKKGSCVRLSVSDNGIGIPQSDLPRIFEKGFTGQNGRLIQSSTGIGLYLCKRLCDRLGIGLDVFSDSWGTTAVLSFQINDFVDGVKFCLNPDEPERSPF